MYSRPDVLLASVSRYIVFLLQLHQVGQHLCQLRDLLCVNSIPFGYYICFSFASFKWDNIILTVELLVLTDQLSWSWFTSRFLPIAVARSAVWSIKDFACSNPGIVDSNPTRGMGACLRLFCVCLILCVQVAALRQALRLRNWSETKCFTGALCSKWEQQQQWWIDR
jgi:hypothetical protein